MPELPYGALQPPPPEGDPAPCHPRRVVRDGRILAALHEGRDLDDEMLASMNDDPVLFGLANPDPEFDHEAARERGAVVATGRSDLPNQINNVLAFPGVFRGFSTDLPVRSIPC